MAPASVTAAMERICPRCPAEAGNAWDAMVIQCLRDIRRSVKAGRSGVLSGGLRLSPAGEAQITLF